MEREADSKSAHDALALDMQIIKAAFEDDIPMRELERADIGELLIAAKTIHFAMQEIVCPKFLELDPLGQSEPEETLKSAFDDYDEENGYNDAPEILNFWQTCKENTDRIIKLAIRIMGDSWGGLQRMDIMSLLDHLKFEIATIKENKN